MKSLPFFTVLVFLVGSMVCFAAEPAPADTGSPELYACCYGRSAFPERYAFKDGRKDATLEIAWSFYVARSGSQITLIDAGFSDPALAKQWKLTSVKPPEQLLADLHIDPAKVSRVIVTHLHFDHLNNITLFPHAQIVMSRRDRDDYVAHKPLSGMIYKQEVADILRDETRTHVIDQRETLPGGFDFEVVGGHTAGSAVVHLKHKGVHYVLAGDECYLCANCLLHRPIGIAANSAKNAQFLQSIADPAIVVLPCHDPSIFTRYPVIEPEIVRIF